MKALKDLRHDTSQFIVTVDKGVASVVWDKQDYLNMNGCFSFCLITCG